MLTIPTKLVGLLATLAIAGSAYIYLRVGAVIPPSHGEAEPIAACEELGVTAAGRKCYEEALTAILVAEGADRAVALLSPLEQASPIVKTYCHGIAHVLGHAGFAHYGSMKDALSHGTMDCFAGYFHGVLEVALPEAPEYATAIKEACAGTSQRDGEFKFYQCVHGLGHGVTAFRQYDVEEALSDCDLLSTDWQRTSCHGGVFMENIDIKLSHAMGAVRQGRLQDDGSDFWPCLAVAAGYRVACLRMITARILPAHSHNWQYAATACDGLTNPVYRSACFESYGRDAAGEALHTSLSRVNELCDAAPADVRDTCYQTAAAVIATHYVDPERPKEICERAGEWQEACERGRKDIARSLAG
jgi:hypothetical protein